MIAPERITLYCRPKEEGVYHAFPVDSSNANHDTAISWARGNRWARDYNNKKEPIKFEFLNVDFDDVTIESLDIRGEGGRAYQVILRVDEDKFRVDLREDTLMDVIRNTGIQAGGRLNGTFCFVKDGSQTKLIREGTELHKRAIAEREKRETFTKNISRKDLKPGYRYRTLNNSTGIFLGFVHTVSLNKDTGEVSNPQKHMLFIKNYDEDVIDLLHEGKINYSEGRDKPYAKVSCYDFDITKNHTFRIEDEQVINDVDLAKFVDNIRFMAKLEYGDKMATQNYSRWFDSFKDAYMLSTMAVDKKDCDADKNAGIKILRKCQEYYNRSRW